MREYVATVFPSHYGNRIHGPDLKLIKWLTMPVFLLKAPLKTGFWLEAVNFLSSKHTHFKSHLVAPSKTKVLSSRMTSSIEKVSIINNGIIEIICSILYIHYLS